MAYVTLRNISGDPLQIGTPDAARRVDTDEVIRIEGTLAKEQYSDAVVIVANGVESAYPMSLWSKVATGKSGEPDVPAPATAEENG